MSNHPTIWAHIEGGELVNADERITDLCCAPLEAVRYESAEYIEADRAAVSLQAKRELLEEIRAYTAAAYPHSGDWQRRYEALLGFLAAKHSQPGGVK